jgi:hypothetical protein
MAFRTLLPDALLRFTLEDVFAAGNQRTEKLAWVSGWRRLPHISAEVQRLFEYPQQFAEDIFSRMQAALGHCAEGAASVPFRTGRLFIGAAGAAELPLRYVRSSDPALVEAKRAEFQDETRLLHDRREGMFVLSDETPGGWIAITKDLFTEILGVGQDARIAGLSAVAAETLRLMYPTLVGRGAR